MAPRAPAAKPQSTAVVARNNGLPAIEKIDAAEMEEMQGVEGAGISDNVEDRGVPLLYIAQKGSKQVNTKEVKFIEGLNVGDCFNNLTGEIFRAEEDGVLVLPCFFRVVYNKWTPQDSGGGFHGSYPRDTDLIKQGTAREGRGDIIDMPDGDEMILTHMYYCLLKDGSPIIVAMSSSNLSCSKIFQNLMAAQKAETPDKKIVQKPGFWNFYRLNTYYDKNESGDWYRYRVAVDGPQPDKELRELCKTFSIGCKEGTIKESTPDGDQLGGAKKGGRDDAI